MKAWPLNSYSATVRSTRKKMPTDLSVTANSASVELPDGQEKEPQRRIIRQVKGGTSPRERRRAACFFKVARPRIPAEWRP